MSAVVLRCQEYFPGVGLCGRPAEFVCGTHVSERTPFADYPCCRRCAGFWAPELRYRLSEHDLALLEFVDRWTAFRPYEPSGFA
jgi:hypothetical protein